MRIKSENQEDLALTYGPAKTRLEQEFELFHAANPHVYAMLLKLARRWREKHAGPCGMAMLYELARWDVLMATDSPDGFKLCNNHRAYYARRIMEENPDLGGIFNLRTVAGE